MYLDIPKRERSDKPPECKIKPLIYGKEGVNKDVKEFIPRVDSGLLNNASLSKLEADIAFLNH